MAANPITHLEIEAFSRLRLVQMTAWEVNCLTRLDDAVLRVWAEKTRTASPKTEETAPAEIPATQPRAIASMFRGIAARRAK